MQKSSMLTAVSALSWFATLGGMATAQSLHGKEAFGDWQRDKPGSVVGFAGRAGHLRASGPPKTVVANLPHGSGHSARDIVFTADGKRMLVSVGSAGSDGEELGAPPGGLKSWTSRHALGAAWS